MIYLSTAIGLPPGGSGTVHIYTQTIHRTTQQQNNTNNKQNNTINKFGRVLAVPSLCELYPGICLTTEGKARLNLSQCIRRDSQYTHYQDTHKLQNPHIHTHTHITRQFKTTRVQIKQTQYKIYPNEIDSKYNQIPSV
jgi:hypothetical protein